MSRKSLKRRGKNFDRVILCDIESFESGLLENYLECIVFNGILEHVFYPWIVLKKMCAYLKSKGVVIASIPNVRYFENVKNLILYGKWQYEDAGILDKTHLR